MQECDKLAGGEALPPPPPQAPSPPAVRANSDGAWIDREREGRESAISSANQICNVYICEVIIAKPRGSELRARAPREVITADREDFPRHTFHRSSSGRHTAEQGRDAAPRDTTAIITTSTIIIFHQAYQRPRQRHTCLAAQSLQSGLMTGYQVRGLRATSSVTLRGCVHQVHCKRCSSLCAQRGASPRPAPPRRAARGNDRPGRQLLLLIGITKCNKSATNAPLSVHRVRPSRPGSALRGGSGLCQSLRRCGEGGGGLCLGVPCTMLKCRKTLRPYTHERDE